MWAEKIIMSPKIHVSFSSLFLVDDIELFESSYIPVKHPVPDKAGFDEVTSNNIIL